MLLLLAAFVFKVLCEETSATGYTKYTQPIIVALPDTRVKVGNMDGFIGAVAVGVVVGIVGFVMSIVSTCVCVRPLVLSHQQKDDFGDIEVDDFSD